MASQSEPLLTTTEVAELLQVHPKRVYRLVREGLPGRRLGGEWRFVRPEVLGWVQRGGALALATKARAAGSSPTEPAVAAAPSLEAPPPFLAANGDVAVEVLLALVNAARPVLGFLQADRDQALGLLEAGSVLAAGSHGKGPPARLGPTRLARIHLVKREVGLAAAAGRKVPSLAELRRLRFAARPASAGAFTHLQQAVRKARLDLKEVLARATLLPSHREVVMAVLRGEADVGLVTHAWAARAGLAFRALAEESYGLLVRAADLGDPRVVRLCEVAQSDRYPAQLTQVPGYDPTDAGTIHYDADRSPQQAR